MTTSFVGSASAEATSLTLPAHQAGDLLIMLAGATGTTSPPAIPAGWRFATQSSGSGVSPPAIAGTVAWKIAADSAEISGTWTNANALICAVIRHTTNVLVVGGIAKATALSATVNYAVLLANSGQSIQGMRFSSSYIILPVIATSNTSDIDTAPTAATTTITSIAGAAAIVMAIHRTNTEVASWASTNYTANTSVRFATWTIEVLDTGFAKASVGGMLIHPGMSGGMRG